ncbi:MAG: Hsp33 family molecular chaperone HslO [Candidatus Cloacimonetes bacterium]|nr:Hsp33 family molecular chaperone HslO [Candidatus Cloacimonadota bacterium]
MRDKIIRGITKDKHVRFFAVDSTQTTRHAAKIHNLSITNSVLLGRMLSAALMIGAELKSNRDVITLKIDCDGPVGGVLVTADKNGNVKGYVNNPEIETPFDEETKQFGVKAAIGKGILTIIKDLGMKNPYIGQVDLQYGTIARDLTHYFVKSEQIPSSVGLGVLIDPSGKIRQSGGFIIQLMPEAPEDVISKVENNLYKFPNLTDVMDMGYSIEEIIKKFILKDLEPEIKMEIPAQYKCNCSYKKFGDGIKLLEKEELKEAIKKNEVLTIHCHFCNKDYKFGREKIKEILEKAK